MNECVLYVRSEELYDSILHTEGHNTVQITMSDCNKCVMRQARNTNKNCHNLCCKNCDLFMTDFSYTVNITIAILLPLQSDVTILTTQHFPPCICTHSTRTLYVRTTTFALHSNAEIDIEALKARSV